MCKSHRVYFIITTEIAGYILKQEIENQIQSQKQVSWIDKQNEKLNYLNNVLLPLGIDYIGEEN